MAPSLCLCFLYWHQSNRCMKLMELRSDNMIISKKKIVRTLSGKISSFYYHQTVFFFFWRMKIIVCLIKPKETRPRKETSVPFSFYSISWRFTYISALLMNTSLRWNQEDWNGVLSTNLTSFGLVVLHLNLLTEISVECSYLRVYKCCFGTDFSCISQC